MIASVQCSHETRSKYGRDRKGNQRWKCQGCGCTITDAAHVRPLGDMRTDLDDAATVLKLILEGMSIRSCERVTGINRNTICDLILQVGEQCDAFLERTVRGLAVEQCQLDEQWSFVTMKNKTAQQLGRGPDVGDSWTWYAIDAQSKLILAHVTGQRDEETCKTFLRRVNRAITGTTQVTSDGLGLYTYNVPMEMGSRVDFAQLVKHYANPNQQNSTRYSPATITGIEKVPRFGNPNMYEVSTSYSERFNLTVRMQNRRCTRLTNGHSKSRPHHAAMHSLLVAFYNFARPNLAHKVKGQPARTPAMVAGLTDHVWTIEELLKVVAGT